MPALIFIALWLIGIASWITHVVVCIAQGKIGLLFLGAIIFPIGNIHGIGVWFGMF